MSIVQLTNSTSPNAVVERPTADDDPYERQTQLNNLAHNFDEHDHTAGKNLGVGRVQVAAAPAVSGAVQLTGDFLRWWGTTVGAVRTAVNAESDQTLTGRKTFTAAVSADGGLYVNDTANANMTLGATLNQGAATNEALALKGSDVAHGMTTLAETDTYATLLKQQGAAGGLTVVGYSETFSAVSIIGRQTSDDPNKATTSTGAVTVDGQTKLGTGVSALGANANILAVRNNTTTRFILDGDGDSHQDVGTSWTTFDSYDDASLLTTLADAVARPGDAIREEFRQWLIYRREDLERAGLVTFHEDGHHFVNMSRLTMLLVGAARQAGARLAALEARVAPLERRLLALEGAGGTP